jgi:hypothetical protein
VSSDGTSHGFGALSSSSSKPRFHFLRRFFFFASFSSSLFLLALAHQRKRIALVLEPHVSEVREQQLRAQPVAALKAKKRPLKDVHSVRVCAVRSPS